MIYNSSFVASFIVGAPSFILSFTHSRTDLRDSFDLLSPYYYYLGDCLWFIGLRIYFISSQLPTTSSHHHHHISDTLPHISDVFLHFLHWNAPCTLCSASHLHHITEELCRHYHMSFLLSFCHHFIVPHTWLSPRLSVNQLITSDHTQVMLLPSP